MTGEVERYIAPVEGKVVTACGEVQDWCQCVSPPHADGPHECECGGSWEWQDGVLVMHSPPGSAQAGPSLASMLLGSLFDQPATDDWPGPEVCHVTRSGVRVHLKPGCRCPRRKR